VIKTIVTSEGDLQVALARLDALEGYYSNEATDRGGETYRGVARIPNPNWEGWVIVDGLRADPDFPDCLRTNQELSTRVEEFYRVYWKQCGADCIADAILRGLHFEAAVNIGTRHAIKTLQLILRLLDQGTPPSERLELDGSFGDKTYTLLVRLTSEQPERVHYYYRCGILGHYLELILTHPEQVVYLNGWVKRLELG